MKKIGFLFCALCSLTSYSQTYFYEDFNCEIFDYLDSLFQNENKNAIWHTAHAAEKVDIFENGLIDSEENFKKTSIVPDPFDKNSKILRFKLNRVSFKFYEKYSCDDNVIDDLVVNRSFDLINNRYCIDCVEDNSFKKILSG